MRTTTFTSYDDKCVALGNYIVDNNTTIRATAKAFGISKSTVHKNVTIGLEEINRQLSKSVRNVLQNNKEERSYRGGLATKKKWQNIKEQRSLANS